VSSNRFDPLDENEREWLRSSRRARRRRAWVTIAGIAIVLGLLVWLIVILLPTGRGGIGNVTVSTSVDERVIADSRSALQDWGRFGVSGDLNAVKASFWPDGPQYKQLSKESPRIRAHPLGPPAYKFELTGAPQVLPAGSNQRIVRGVVTTSRKGEPTRSYRWDIYLRPDPGSGGRWRVWTVANTPQG
jgi:hypothetical protein